MRNWILAGFVLIALSVVAALALTRGESGIRDTELGLSKTSVFDTPVPEVTRANLSEPGDRPTVPAGFPQQPVLIPHGVGEFLPITMTENQCLECHAVEEKEEGEPTPVPQSHYVDLRNAPGVVRDEVAGSRYICVSCHVSPGENAPLVGNMFGK
jgi:cytochrome c-type protein NapB